MENKISDKKIGDAISGLWQSIKSLLPEQRKKIIIKERGDWKEQEFIEPKIKTPLDNFWFQLTKSIEENPSEWKPDTHTVKHKKSGYEIWTSNRDFADLTMYHGPIGKEARCPAWLRPRLRNAIDTIGLEEAGRNLGFTIQIGDDTPSEPDPNGESTY